MATVTSFSHLELAIPLTSSFKIGRQNSSPCSTDTKRSQIKRTCSMGFTPGLPVFFMLLLNMLYTLSIYYFEILFQTLTMYQLINSCLTIYYLTKYSLTMYYLTFFYLTIPCLTFSCLLTISYLPFYFLGISHLTFSYLVLSLLLIISFPTTSYLTISRLIIS